MPSCPRHRKSESLGLPYVTYLFDNYFFEGLYVGSFLPQYRCFFDIASRALVSLPGGQSSVFQ